MAKLCLSQTVDGGPLQLGTRTVSRGSKNRIKPPRPPIRNGARASTRRALRRVPRRDRALGWSRRGPRPSTTARRSWRRLLTLGRERYCRSQRGGREGRHAAGRRPEGRSPRAPSCHGVTIPPKPSGVRTARRRVDLLAPEGRRIVITAPARTAMQAERTTGAPLGRATESSSARATTVDRLAPNLTVVGTGSAATPCWLIAPPCPSTECSSLSCRAERNEEGGGWRNAERRRAIGTTQLRLLYHRRVVDRVPSIELFHELERGMAAVDRREDE